MKGIFFCIFLLSLLEFSPNNLAPKVSHPLSEKQMVICIPSYNNALFYKRNLDSVFSQEYKNYRVLYVDDASTDSTLELVRQYVKERGLEDKITILHNKVNIGALANWYKMVHLLDGDEIVISLDGDDFLAHSGVLRRVNEAYADERVWVTYGKYSTYPEGKTGPSHRVNTSFFKRGGHRQSKFYWSHLRTFYARLFKKMPISQFQNEKGEFYSMAGDVAIMQGLIDMAPEHVFYIPSVLYRYNRENVLSDDYINQRRQVRCARQICKKEPLARVDHWKGTL